MSNPTGPRPSAGDVPAEGAKSLGPQPTLASEDRGQGPARDPVEEKPTAVGRMACGCCVAAFVVPEPGDSPELFSDYAKELRAWARSGMTTEMRTVGWVRHTPKEDGGLGVCNHRQRRGERARKSDQLDLAVTDAHLIGTLPHGDFIR